VEPLDRSTIWPYREGEPGELYYQRYAHPNGLAAERALAELEGGEALLFPSGAGATTALVLGLLEQGQTIALAEGGYYGTGVLFAALERWGVRFIEFDQTGPPPEGVDLVWLEAPSNPFLTMPDFEASAAHPARVVVDSTAATPVYLRPLRLRASQRHQVSRRPPRRPARRGRLPLGRGRGAPARVPRPHGDRGRARSLLAAAEEPEDTAGADGPAYRFRAGARKAPG
jgi:Cys/Met metabolism PLP-dependent enzyme